LRSFFGPMRVRVWGERACFTRPECKVDRVSYPIMTPTAARGVLEAIYWHPEIYWRVLEIWNLKAVKWFSWMVNEVTGDKGVSKEWSAMNPYNASDHRCRAQRHMLGLRDVEYLIIAEIVARDGTSGGETKHRDIFRNDRLKRGACAYQPFLGVREFTAYFAPGDGVEKAVPLPEEDLGTMVGSLFDLTIDPRLKIDAKSRVPFEAKAPGGILRVDASVYEPRVKS
jgi:CRISPR-associated protein Cas5d